MGTVKVVSLVCSQHIQGRTEETSEGGKAEGIHKVRKEGRGMEESKLFTNNL